MEAISVAGSNFFQLIYLDSPLKRFLGTAGFVTFLEFLIKPKYAFDPTTGKLRPVCNPFSDKNEPGCTYLPVALIPMLLGAVAALYF